MCLLDFCVIMDSVVAPAVLLVESFTILKIFNCIRESVVTS